MYPGNKISKSRGSKRTIVPVLKIIINVKKLLIRISLATGAQKNDKEHLCKAETAPKEINKEEELKKKSHRIKRKKAQHRNGISGGVRCVPIP
uniref:Uncharacterized protein n=1 Tax=Bracon brevicornis TaxID=1563983 RepID=A0A6V7LZ01_9HYME